jgi:hypothetical protein
MDNGDFSFVKQKSLEGQSGVNAISNSAFLNIHPDNLILC